MTRVRRKRSKRSTEMLCPQKKRARVKKRWAPIRTPS